ncbi:hypothetical protein CHSO_1059 [Chryseobacterium sp. StRB126]|nr:hypothetical protein [Chryseobacterium sp. StRB126]BAP30096.1 hypothetical protein CHSO_1059 [Chryseobacterium sp. StRB126]
MKDKDGYWTGRDANGLFKWNEKRLIRIENDKKKNEDNRKNNNHKRG